MSSRDCSQALQVTYQEEQPEGVTDHTAHSRTLYFLLHTTPAEVTLIVPPIWRHPPISSLIMLKFATFTSDIELPFYTSLASHKINHDKLDDSARRLLGLYEIRPYDQPESSCRLQIHSNALTTDTLVNQTIFAAAFADSLCEGCPQATSEPRA